MNEVKGIIEDFTLPTIEGSEKQIDWAMKIRNQAAATLKYEVTHVEWKEGQPKRSVESLLIALESEESIQNHLDNVPEFLVEKTTKSMNDLLDRYARLIEIATNPSSEFWIDNRDNQEKNHKFNKFAKYVQTGVKEF